MYKRQDLDELNEALEEVRKFRESLPDKVLSEIYEPLFIAAQAYADILPKLREFKEARKKAEWKFDYKCSHDPSLFRLVSYIQHSSGRRVPMNPLLTEWYETAARIASELEV